MCYRLPLNSAGGLNRKMFPTLFVGNQTKALTMIIMAFSNKTSKILPRIFCGKIKHVAPIVVRDDKLMLYQFVCHGKIVKIPLLARDIEILKAHGWRFIYLRCALPQSVNLRRIYTCVKFAKSMIGMHNIFIQTPGALYRKLGN